MAKDFQGLGQQCLFLWYLSILFILSRRMLSVASQLRSDSALSLFVLLCSCYDSWSNDVVMRSMCLVHAALARRSALPVCVVRVQGGAEQKRPSAFYWEVAINRSVSRAARFCHTRARTPNNNKKKCLTHSKGVNCFKICSPGCLALTFSWKLRAQCQEIVVSQTKNGAPIMISALSEPRRWGKQAGGTPRSPQK